MKYYTIEMKNITTPQELEESFLFEKYPNMVILDPNDGKKIYIYDKSTPTNHFIIQSDDRLLYRLDPPVNCNQKSQTVIQQDWAHGAWAALLGGHAYDLTAYRNDFLKLLPLLGWTAKNRTINAADLEKQFNYFILLKTIAVYLKSISAEQSLASQELLNTSSTIQTLLKSPTAYQAFINQHKITLDTLIRADFNIQMNQQIKHIKNYNSVLDTRNSLLGTAFLSASVVATLICVSLGIIGAVSFSTFPLVLLTMAFFGITFFLCSVSSLSQTYALYDRHQQLNQGHGKLITLAEPIIIPVKNLSFFKETQTPTGSSHDDNTKIPLLMSI